MSPGSNHEWPSGAHSVGCFAAIWSRVPILFRLFHPVARDVQFQDDAVSSAATVERFVTGSNRFINRAARAGRRTGSCLERARFCAGKPTPRASLTNASGLINAELWFTP